jgi:pimeloyl-ACP methyl ester carboxylesterase
LDNKIIRLSDGGRNLGYAEHGDLQGCPLFFFHGQPGNRLFRHPDDMLTSSLGVRLICIDRPGYGLSEFQPNRRLLEIYFRLFWRFSRPNPDAFLKMAVQHSCQADKDALSQPGLSSVLQEVWKVNIRIESLGYTYDIEILMRDWSFQLKNIQKDIHVWQGEADANIPMAWARYLAKELPHCQATFFPDEGHFALFQHWEEILQTMR